MVSNQDSDGLTVLEDLHCLSSDGKVAPELASCFSLAANSQNNLAFLPNITIYGEHFIVC